jgi:ketosteroid isomerase-like protein
LSGRGASRALLVALAACGGAAKPAGPVAEPAVDERAAEKDAKGLVVEIYRTLDRGKTDSMFSLLSDPLIVFGPRRGDAMTTRADALVALGKIIDPKAKKRTAMRSSGLSVVVSQGGHSAWAFDVVNFEGQSVAVTAVLSNTSDLWSVSAAALAALPSAGKVKAESARDAIVPPGAASTGKIGAQAQAVVDEFKKGLVDQDSWGTDLMSRSDAIVAGPSAGQVARGKHAIQQMWKMRTKAGVREATSGELTAQVTPDGQLAWLSAPVTRVADGEDPLPLRIFAVYEREGAAWKLIVLHEAVAIDEPGSGTPFKKIVPPAPAPKVEPAKPDAKPADAAKAKSKKKKKPRPPRAEGD